MSLRRCPKCAGYVIALRLEMTTDGGEWSGDPPVWVCKRCDHVWPADAAFQVEHEDPNRQPARLLLSTAEAAELLGMHESALHRWVREGRVPAKVMHGAGYGSSRRKFSRVQLERWAANELDEAAG